MSDLRGDAHPVHDIIIMIANTSCATVFPYKITFLYNIGGMIFTQVRLKVGDVQTLNIYVIIMPTGRSHM